jgi:hypothetical protein
MSKKTLEQVFWERVEKSGGCWAWRGGTTRFGYGRISHRIDGRVANFSAHRLSWEIHNGSIPGQLWVLHTCDNPPCTNPEHLFLGTRSDNTHDAVQKGRWGRINRPLNPEKVRAIRALYSAGGITEAQLGERFGVTRACIGNVLQRRTWADIN